MLLVDVSSAQRKIDWTRAIAWVGTAGERLEGAITKCTEGNADNPDPQFANNWAGILAAGLPRGAYHFAHPDSIHKLDAADEATRFVAQINKCGGFRPGLDFAALDIEQARDIANGKAFTDWVILFCETVDHLTGSTCGIYTGGPFFDEHDGAPDQEAIDKLSKRWLWIAAYTKDPDKFVNMTVEWRHVGWVMHQRSGDIAPTGEQILHIDGITGNVDKDVYRGTLEEFKNWVASLSLVVPAPEAPKTPNQPIVPGNWQVGSRDDVLTELFPGYTPPEK